ncbi:hypothetical protein C8Q74DRAFT_78498 [Fomes fomentarius]|nr:hypothetical protein C8Q74DRAFT_78498 [Fomes fomentarius]
MINADARLGTGFSARILVPRTTLGEGACFKLKETYRNLIFAPAPYSLSVLLGSYFILRHARLQNYITSHTSHIETSISKCQQNLPPQLPSEKSLIMNSSQISAGCFLSRTRNRGSRQGQGGEAPARVAVACIFLPAFCDLMTSIVSRTPPRTISALSNMSSRILQTPRGHKPTSMLPGAQASTRTRLCGCRLGASSGNQL